MPSVSLLREALYGCCMEQVARARTDGVFPARADYLALSDCAPCFFPISHSQPWLFPLGIGSRSSGGGRTPPL